MLPRAEAFESRDGDGTHKRSGGVARVGSGASRHGAMKRSRETAARYPIRAVSRLTGLGIDTLRAWERRHGAVTPARDERGRMYTEGDVARLRLLRGAVEQGHSIGRIAGLSDAELRQIAAAAGRGAVRADEPMRRPALDTAALTAALRRFDAAGIDQEIARLATVLRPLDLVRSVLMPMLAQVGDDWHKKRAGVAHEHLLSATIRNILGSFLRLHARPEMAARLLFATPAGDRHEIGTLGAAMLAASSGLGVAYLGPDLPARDILDSVKPAGAQVLVLGVTTALAAKAKEIELRAIVRGLPKGVELWVGGPAAARHAGIIGNRGLVLHDYDAYQKELVRIGGRA
jgi:DNA-binding transcriptional MerR regulator/methylmalonyl-CoA mutase cobalamin-binding subunit